MKKGNLYKYDNLLIIGNGFDLSLNLKTRYSDFIDSNIWKDFYRQYEKDKDHQLLHFLQGKRIIEEWFDIEQLLLEYAAPKMNKTIKIIETDKKDYEKIQSLLAAYLDELLTRCKSDISESTAAKLLRKISQSNSNRNKIYSFNYTSLMLISKVIGISNMSIPVIYVHGEAEKDNAILGIESSDVEAIDVDYSFMIKTNHPSYKAIPIANDLKKAKEVIFFGHSLNAIDFGYFDDYFEFLMTNEDEDRRLTLITKDHNSQRTLLDNLRLNRIDVLKLFTHANMEILKNGENTKDSSNDRASFDGLLNRI